MEFKEFLKEEDLQEGLFGDGIISFLEKAYGTKYNTYKLLFNGIDRSLLKTAEQCIIEPRDKKMPIRLISNKRNSILGIWLSSGTLKTHELKQTYNIEDIA